MKKICRVTGKEFEITNEDLEFYKKVSPKIGGTVYEVPPPTLCPEARCQRRMSWRNERKLYSRTCDLTKASIVSMYDTGTSFPVYSNEAWHGDDWSAFDYGRDFDFSKSFFENFEELSRVAPRINLMNQNSENSVFCNYAFANKNCYLLFGSHYNEDSMYSEYSWKTKNCIDCSEVLQSELVYEGIYSENCYSCRHIEYCFQCSDCEYCYELVGCKNCFLSANLRNKEYYFMNQECTPGEYFRKKEEYKNKSPEELMKCYREIKEGTIHRLIFQKNCENCSGGDIQHSKNIRSGFSTKYCEDIAYSSGQVSQTKDAMDVNYIGYDASELLYECIGNSGNTRVLFCNACWHNSDILYSQQCFGSSHLFGCIGLKHAQYCILNKQYTKEEYEELVPKIIEHMKQTPLNPPLSGGRNACEWGEFFPIEISPFAYNETVAQEYYPLKEEEVLERGWRWKEESDKVPNGEKRIPAEKLPDSIGDIPDDILNWAIECEESKKPFKIQKAELEFYRKMNLPVPHFHPDVRHKHRMKLRNPRRLWKRVCDKCRKEIESTFNPERKEIVYCEECYLESVN